MRSLQNHAIPSLVSNDTLLAYSTLVLGVATVGLVIVGALAAHFALRELRGAQESLLTTKKIAEADAARRRAEATLSAIRRFMAEHDEEYPTMLNAARAITEKRKARANGQAFSRCSVEELLNRPDAPEEAIRSLRRLLDSIEEIALGCRLGVYESNMVFHMAQTKLGFTYQQGRGHIDRVRGGRAASHISQGSAWEHVEWLVTTRFAAIRNAGAPAKLAGALED